MILFHWTGPHSSMKKEAYFSLSCLQPSDTFCTGSDNISGFLHNLVNFCVERATTWQPYLMPEESILFKGTDHLPRAWDQFSDFVLPPPLLGTGRLSSATFCTISSSSTVKMSRSSMWAGLSHLTSLQLVIDGGISSWPILSSRLFCSSLSHLGLLSSSEAWVSGLADLEILAAGYLETQLHRK